MPYTIEQYNAITEAIASGASSVKYADKEVTYRSLEEMLRVQAAMRAELFPAEAAAKGRRKYVEYHKGVFPQCQS